MFKILVLETLYTLSDDAAEFQIKDRIAQLKDSWGDRPKDASN